MAEPASAPLEAERDRLLTALRHLRRSQRELAEALRDAPDDADFKDAISENEQVRRDARAGLRDRRPRRGCPPSRDGRGLRVRAGLVLRTSPPAVACLPSHACAREKARGRALTPSARASAGDRQVRQNRGRAQRSHRKGRRQGRSRGARRRGRRAGRCRWRGRGRRRPRRRWGCVPRWWGWRAERRGAVDLTRCARRDPARAPRGAPEVARTALGRTSAVQHRALAALRPVAPVTLLSCSPSLIFCAVPCHAPQAHSHTRAFKLMKVRLSPAIIMRRGHFRRARESPRHLRHSARERASGGLAARRSRVRRHPALEDGVARTAGGG